MRKLWLSIGALALAGGVVAQSAAGDPKVYKIGAILAMSGQASWYGTVMSQGIKQAVEEINAKGGVNGIPLEAVIDDHKSGNAQEGVSAMNRLLSIHGAKIVLTSFSAPTQAIAPLADQNQVLLLNGGGVSNNLVGASKYIFHNRSLAGDLGRAAAQHAQSLGAKRMAVLHWKNDAGDNIVRAVQPMWEKGGGSIVAVAAVPQGATHMDTQIAKVRASNPDSGARWMFTPEVGIAVKRLRELGMNQPLIGVEYTANDAKIAREHGEAYLFINNYFHPSPHFPSPHQFPHDHEKPHTPY